MGDQCHSVFTIISQIISNKFVTVNLGKAETTVVITSSQETDFAQFTEKQQY